MTSIQTPAPARAGAGPSGPLWRRPGGLLLGGLALIASVMLLTGHASHLIAALPLLLLLACPLMHLFMHHGHRTHGGSDHTKNDPSGAP